MLPENTADSPLGQLQFRPDMVNASTMPRGAQKFPDAASIKIDLAPKFYPVVSSYLAFGLPIWAG